MSKYELLPQAQCVWFSQRVRRWYRTLSVYWRVLWQFWVLSARTRAIRTSTNISLRVYPRSSGGFSCQKLSKPETNVFLKGLPLQETHKHYLVSSKPCLDQLWQCCNRTSNVSILYMYFTPTIANDTKTKLLCLTWSKSLHKCSSYTTRTYLMNIGLCYLSFSSQRAGNNVAAFRL